VKVYAVNYDREYVKYKDHGIQNYTINESENSQIDSSHVK